MKDSALKMGLFSKCGYSDVAFNGCGDSPSIRKECLHDLFDVNELSLTAMYSLFLKFVRKLIFYYSEYCFIVVGNEGYKIYT